MRKWSLLAALAVAVACLWMLSSVSAQEGKFPEGEQIAEESVVEAIEGDALSHEEVEAEVEEEQMWKWANFVLLAGALGYMMAKFLPPVFADRTKEIQKDITEAQAAKSDADRRAADVDARLARLSKDIDTFRAQAASDMQAEGERIRKETAAQIKRVEEQAAVEIDSAGKAARHELKDFAAELALKLAEQRIASSLDAATTGKLVDGFIAGLGQEQAKRGVQN